MTEFWLLNFRVEERERDREGGRRQRERETAKEWP